MDKKMTAKKKIERLRRFSFLYAKGVRKDINKESMFRVNANMWFSPFIKEMDTQRVKIAVTFLSELENKFSFENITYDLKRKAIAYYNSFRTEVLF